MLPLKSKALISYSKDEGNYIFLEEQGEKEKEWYIELEIGINKWMKIKGDAGIQ